MGKWAALLFLFNIQLDKKIWISLDSTCSPFFTLICMHDLDTSNANDRFKMMEYSLQQKTKRKKVLGTLAVGEALTMLLSTITFATLVKEMSLTHHPDVGPIDSAKNSEVPFIHFYKNHQFQYDTYLKSSSWLKKFEWKKCERNLGFFSTLQMFTDFPKENG